MLHKKCYSEVQCSLSRHLYARLSFGKSKDNKSYLNIFLFIMLLGRLVWLAVIWIAMCVESMWCREVPWHKFSKVVVR